MEVNPEQSRSAITVQLKTVLSSTSISLATGDTVASSSAITWRTRRSSCSLRLSSAQAPNRPLRSDRPSRNGPS